MRTKASRDIPIGVMLIACFYIFGALVLLLCIVTNPIQVSQSIADVHGLSAVSGPWVLVVVAALALAISYGLLSLARWGFALAIAYLVSFGAINFVLALADPKWSVHAGNALWAILVVLYLVFRRGAFFARLPDRDNAPMPS